MKNETGSTIGIGTVLAVLLSWTTNHSVVWSVIHGHINWIYVFYWLLAYGQQ